MKKVYVDVDDVLGDFTKHFRTTIDSNGISRKSFDDYENNIKDHDGGWWITMPPRKDAGELMSYLHKNKFDLNILSASPVWDPDAKRQKIEWINKYFPFVHKEKIFIVRRSEKKDFATTGAILIDDYDKNIREWVAEGGIGILHTNTTNTIRELSKIGLR